jgi:hypothetical protein
VGPLGLAMVHSSVRFNGRVKFPTFYEHLRSKVVQPEDSDGRYRVPVRVCDLAAAGDDRIIVEADWEKAYAHCVHHAHHWFAELDHGPGHITEVHAKSR